MHVDVPSPLHATACEIVKGGVHPCPSKRLKTVRARDEELADTHKRTHRSLAHVAHDGAMLLFSPKHTGQQWCGQKLDPFCGETTNGGRICPGRFRTEIYERCAKCEQIGGCEKTDAENRRGFR